MPERINFQDNSDFTFESQNKNEASKIEKVYDKDKIKLKLDMLLSEIPNGSERINEFYSKIKTEGSVLFKSKKLEFQAFIDGIKSESTEIKSDSTLVNYVSDKIMDFIQNNYTPSELEAGEREKFIERGGFTPLNELLSYNINNNEAHIHLAPARTISNSQKLLLIRDGLHRLASLLATEKSLDNINTISATSTIVESHPKILEKFGFRIDGPINEDLRNREFSGQTKNIRSAHMDKSKFQELYLR
jgi:hypothetical protein